MIPCLNLEDAIAQVSALDERQELEFHYGNFMQDIRDYEAEAEKADEYYDAWQEAENECSSLNDQIDDLEAECDDMEAIKMELSKIAGKSITPGAALHTLNNLMKIVGEAGVVISDGEEDFGEELPF